MILPPLVVAELVSGATERHKNSIQTEVSTTTPATRCLDADRQPEFAQKRERSLVKAAALHLLEPLDQRFGDSFPGDLLSGFQKVSG